MKIGIVCNGFLGSTVALANALAADRDFVDIILLAGMRQNLNNFEALEIYGKYPICIFKQVDKSKTRGLTHLQNQERIRLFINRLPRKNFEGIKSILNIIVNFLRRKLSKLISQQKYDMVIVIGQDMHSSKLSSDLSKYGIINVHTFHEIINRFTDGKMDLSVEDAIKNKIPIIVHSKYCKKQLEQLDNFEYSPNYIPFGTFDGYISFNKNDNEILRRLQSNDNFLLAYGYIKDYKGFDILYDAYLQIKSRGRLNFKIVVAGNGYVPILDKIRNNEDFILINDWISNDETATLFDKCKAVVCPYKSASQSGIPQTAFVFNKPVVATNVGAFAEIINDKNGRLVNDVNTLPDAIVEIMNQDINVTIDECYLWPHIKMEYLKLYNSLKANEAKVN